MNTEGISEFLSKVEVGQEVTLSTTELDHFGNNVSFTGELVKIDKEKNRVIVSEYNDYIKSEIPYIVELSKVYFWNIW